MIKKSSRTRGWFYVVLLVLFLSVCVEVLHGFVWAIKIHAAEPTFTHPRVRASFCGKYSDKSSVLKLFVIVALFAESPVV